MKPLFLKISIILCTLFLWTGMSMATSTGIFVGDSNDLTTNFQPQQDSEINVNALVDLYNANTDTDLPEDLTLIGKWEDGGWSVWNDDSITEFTGSFTGDDGVWSVVSDDWDMADPLYYSLKAGGKGKSGGGFELWYADGFLDGVWDTSGLDNKDLSHISFWTADGTTPADPVPEPATLALVGLGLAGIAGYRRKRHSS
ncbi:MAG: PEP-CTERM sorting domain-containing protein [Desulfotignum sp.]|nr:PEP-CTERM sorting domain-containing protein [Desulfotignum sp.]MCF8087284.1 PEP-CTERM sorting domain-containing protein [Desulfotignum sp.]MCF8136688.1 PEP-CTERM sorting domain-containing protein [Desulfotignum sp.]